jgi:hypothetical protein
MSRQPIRQRPPADDDLQAKTEEEVRKQQPVSKDMAQAAPGLTQTHAAEHALPRPAAGAAPGSDRNAYFTGRYSALGSAGTMDHDKLMASRLAEFGVPDGLRGCILNLIRILGEHGLGSALAALQGDAAIGKEYKSQVGNLLAALAREHGKAATP